MLKYELTNSGIEWLEEIPRHWGVTSIKKEFQVIPSNVDKKTEDNEAEVKLCNYVDVYYNDFITSEIDFMMASASETEINKFQLKIGDVLITKDSEDPFDIAVPALVKHSEDKLLCGYHLSIIRSINNRIEGSYLFWALKDEFIVTQLWREACGVTRWAIASRHIKNSTIPFPPKPEQIAITKYLGKACADIERVVEIKQKQIENLQQQLKSIIHHTVTKGLNPKAEMKASGIDWIGEVPKHWKVDRLKDIAELNYEVLGSQTPNDFVLRYIDISNVNYKGIISLENIEELEFESAPSRARRVIKKGDVIVSSVRPNLQAVAFIELDDDNLICSTGFNVIKAKVHIALPKYLHQFILSEYSKQYFEKTAKGVGYPAVSDRDFNTLYLFLPPVNEQETIIKYLDDEINKVKAAETKIEKQIEVILNYKKSLIHEVVTGKKQVYGLTKEKQQMQTA